MKRGSRQPVRIALVAALGALLLPASSGATVLYDATPSVLGQHPTVGDFETAIDDDDAEAADDFTVPAGQTWTIDRAFVDGRQPGGAGAGPPQYVGVFIYPTDGAGLPDPVAVHSAQINPQAGTAYPDFDLLLPGVPALGPGTYWFAARPRMDFSPGDNFWLWGTSPAPRGATAAYRNPGGGQANDCTVFTTITDCDSLNVTNPTLSFRLEGTCAGCTAAGTPPSTPAPPKCRKGRKLKRGKCVKKKKRKKKP